jgi:hypothetical protein
MGAPAAIQPVALRGKVTRAADRLVVEYELTNQRKQPIYVLDRMVNAKDGTAVLDADLAYVFWEEPRTLRLVRAVLQLPPGKNIGSKEIPYARKVAPGETVAGRISLPVPVAEYNPFYLPPKDWRQVTCDTVRLLIGWTEEREGMVIHERKVGGEPALALRGAWPGPYQELAEAKWQFSVAVKVRPDEFDRRLPQQ